MIYSFQKLFFRSDNDFVLWHLSHNNSLMLEKIIQDKKLDLNIENSFVTLNTFVANASDTKSTSKKHTVHFSIGGETAVHVGQWHYNHFFNLEKNLTKSKPKIR